MTGYDDPSKGWPGGDWILEAPNQVESLWGSGRAVAWPKDEALIVVGGDGSGKTALAGNLMMRQLGVIDTPLFGMTVEPRERVLYLAQDRPQQARRSLKRFIGEIDRATVNDRLTVIDWPIGLLDDDDELLAALASEHDADTLYLDSLKDVSREISSEESGLAIKRAYSQAIAAGVQVALLHHDRKIAQDSKRKILKLADVYGSRWITAGAGSVIALNGGSGDPIIDLRHLKQPDEEVGPLSVAFDFETGDMTIQAGTDILEVIARTPGGMPALDAARILYETDQPTRAEKERARRKLESLVTSGFLTVRKGIERNEPDHYTLAPSDVQAALEDVHETVHGEVY